MFQAAKRSLSGRRHVCLVEGADVGSGRNDLVDPVEDVIREDGVHPREEVVQLLHGAGAEQRTGDTRVRDGERHGEVGHRQPRFFGEWDQLLHRVEAPLITERQREEFARMMLLSCPRRTRPVSMP